MNNGEYNRLLSTLFDYLNIYVMDMKPTYRLQLKKDIDEYFKNMWGIKTSGAAKNE